MILTIFTYIMLVKSCPSYQDIKNSTQIELKETLFKPYCINFSLALDMIE